MDNNSAGYHAFADREIRYSKELEKELQGNSVHFATRLIQRERERERERERDLNSFFTIIYSLSNPLVFHLQIL
jgi:hypothetical protein